MKQGSQKDGSKSVEAEKKFQLLLTLITLLKSTRHKNKKTELEFLMVNQTFNLVPYRNCVYWEKPSDKVIVKNASGLVQIDPEGPYTQWLTRVIQNFLQQQKKHSSKESQDEDSSQNSFSNLHTITAEDCTKSDRSDWKKWVPNNAFLMIMRDTDEDVIGGLWFDREKDLTSLEKAILEDLGDGFAHALQNLKTKKKQNNVFGFKSIFDRSRMKARIFFIALVIIMLFPVRMSATAPAEVVATKPDIISIPFDGVIDSVEVSSGQSVKAGDVLLRMDKTMLNNKVTMTSGELRAAEISLRKTERESMKDRSKLAEISILEAQLSQKRAEANFAREMLGRAEILAERDGIVIFADANSLRGKPVQTGEKVMQLANLEDSEILIRIPVNAIIKINEDIPARFFLNASPFDSHKMQYETIGYQATMDGDGLMTYKIRGKLMGQNNTIRIAWTGTGKVYGDRTVLAVNLLRRPISTLRRKLGF